MEQKTLTAAQPAVHRRVELGEDVGRLRGGGHRETGPLEAELLIGMEVVGRTEEGHDSGEALGAQPQQLFLAPNLAVVGRVAPRPLADGEMVLDDPAEVPRDDPGRPAPSHAAAPRRRRAACARGCDIMDPDQCRAAGHRPHRRGERALEAGAGREQRNVSHTAVARSARAQMTYEALATGPHEHRDPCRHKLGERGQKLQIVADRLAEADARIDVDLLDTGRRGPRRTRLEEPAHLGDDVVIAGVVLHIGGSPFAVHRHKAGAVIGGDRRRGLTRRRSRASLRHERAAWATEALLVSTETRTSRQAPL